MPDAFDLDDTPAPDPSAQNTPPKPPAPAPETTAPRIAPTQVRPAVTIAPKDAKTGAPPAAGNRASDLLRGHPNYKQSVEKDTAPRVPLIAADRRVTPFDDFATGLFWVALVVSVLCLVYYMFGIFAGELSGQALKGIGGDHIKQIESNLGIVNTIMSVSSLVATVLLVFLFYDESFAAYGLVGAAIFLQVLLPLIVGQYLDLSKTATSEPIKMILDLTRSVAIIPGIPGFILLLLAVVRQFVMKLEVSKVAKANLKYGQGMVFKQPKIRNQFLGPCWNMPYCRDTIRSKCPIFIHKKKGPCWRGKRGCMCDETIVLNATSGDWKAQVASTIQMVEGTKSQTVSHAPPPVQHSNAFKKERCRQCVIYNTHQEQKYKALVGITFAGCAVAIGLFAGTLVDGVRVAYAWLDTVLGKMSFSGSAASGSPVANPTSSSIQLGDPVAWVILVLVSIILISKLLQVVEYCCFKIKI